MGTALQILFLMTACAFIGEGVDGYFWSSKTTQQVDLTNAEVYEHPLSASTAKKSGSNQGTSSDRRRRQAYPVFSSSGAEGGLTIEAQRDAGPWGPWNIQKECTRTCGGGVQIEVRTCQSSGCIGPSKRYVSCQTEPCPEGTPNFRNEQCAKFNDRPLEGRYFRWRAYNKGTNKCELLCIPDNENFYYKWMDKVIDGTPCDTMSEDICVEGVCLPLGCDGKLGSTIKQDKCLVCGGDGTGCKTMQGLFDHQILDIGYHDIITIPDGATSVVVQERKPTNNYLTLRNESGHYFLNGNWKIDFPQTLQVAGTFFEYERTRQNGLSFEKLSAKGPLTEPVIIGILHQTENTGIQYEYSIKLDENVPHIYVVDAWGECSVTCGQGIQKRRATCVESLSKTPVAEHLCVNASVPDLNRTCSTEDCDSSWYIGEWEQCSETCGSEGLQYRVTYCHQVRADGTRVTVDDAKCLALTERPAVKRSCNRFPCPEWHPGPWSSCSKPCGDAEQFRSITCRSEKEGEEGKLLGEVACNATGKPQDKRECNLGPCEGLRWVTSEWTLCDRCNDTTETRNVSCRDASGRLFPDDKCSGRRPEDTRECATQPPCLYRWHASQWSECSTVCGHGHQTRNVVCTYEHHRKLHIIEDSHCNPSIKMDTRQNCTNEAECTGTYYTTQWTQCTAECGGGTQNRSVVCLDYDYKVRHELCDESKRPAEAQDCNTAACINCNNTDFGCCPDGVTPAIGFYLEGCSNCSTSEFGCCPDNFTAASGPDLEGCNVVIELEGSGDGIPVNFTGGACTGTEFGCCPDGVTTATGPASEGCLCNYTNTEGVSIEIPCVNLTALNETLNILVLGDDESVVLFNDTHANETEIHCSKTEFGCCPDWYTAAAGRNYFDCPPIITGTCNGTKYGCCPDDLTLSRGPNFSGCGDPECSASRFGCCKDRRTIAFGPHYKGCERSTLTCETSQYGCCPDGETTALGPNGRGCQEDCRLTRYGCCPDGTTTAKGPSNQGCGCIFSQYGCCPDGVNAARGRGYAGCPETCASSHYGCCPDGKTPAGGPNFEGCPCRYTRFGCCPDGETPARGPSNEGCDDCHYAKYGCCQDGVSKATGHNFQGCFPLTTRRPGTATSSLLPPDPTRIAACTLPSSIGEVCGQYQLKYFYDAEGRCRPFWYGGCGGNDNRFDSEDECTRTCINPSGANSLCYLPKMSGPDGCGQTVIRYYYDVSLLQCAPFYYFSCNSNANNFVEYNDCMARCQHVTDRPWLPQPPRPTVHGQATTIVYDDHRHPNLTHHPQPGHTDVPVDICQLAPDSGPCRKFEKVWHWDRVTRRCSHFFYGGCQGNQNRFATKEDCERRCEFEVVTIPTLRPSADPCDQQLNRGSCGGRLEAYYFEKALSECVRFEYTGCGGNSNRFNTLEQCEAKCLRKTTAGVTVQGGASDICTYPKDGGPCDNYVAMWFFNASEGTCARFYYGGCHGNPNRFDSLHECTRQCAERVDPCNLPAVHGPCGSKETRFFWDRNSRTCKEFAYGGCLGNTNNFKSVQQCYQKCGSSEGPRVPLQRPGVISSSFDPSLRADAQQESPSQNVVHAEFEGVCLLPQDVGPCRALIKKFFYDPTNRRCTEFNYGGCRGNRNRFDTLEECQTICENSEYHRQSHEEEQDMSPLGHVDVHKGHLGTTRHAVSATPVPAGHSDDVCSLPADPGPCQHESHNRWFFDVSRGECREFTYGGCVGNHNNFKTLEDCRAYCDRHSKPYSGGLEKPDLGRHPHQNPDHHVGTHQTTTVPPSATPAIPRPKIAAKPYSPPSISLPKPTSPLPELCRQPKDTGSCFGDQLQFYYDWDKGKCIAFPYTGCGGNTNRFQSEETCERACGLYRDQDVCSLPYDEGPCQGNFLKWRYVPESGKCLKFAYGGCDGNGNRFSSREECESLCRQETKTSETDVCEQPKEVGPCRGAVDRYFFNNATRKCELFLFGGCRGNNNNFKTEADCVEQCGGKAKAPVINKAAVVVDDVCNLKRDSGPCTDLISQWYFDHKAGVCKLFTYGGCRGNGNRFDTRTECESRCKNILPLAHLTIKDDSTNAHSQKPPVVQMVSLRSGTLHSVLLNCQTPQKRNTSTAVTWYKDGQRMNDTADDRIKTLANGTMKFATLESADAGGYSCSLKTSGGIVSMPLTMQIQGAIDGTLHARPVCTQDLGITDCRKAVVGGLCRHKYYGPACCQSCARSAIAKRAAAGHRRLRHR